MGARRKQEDELSGQCSNPGRRLAVCTRMVEVELLRSGQIWDIFSWSQEDLLIFCM